MGDGNGHRDNRIDKIDSETDSDYENKPGDYPILQSMVEQANSKVLSESSPAATPEPSTEPEPASFESVLLESSSSQTEIPSSSSSEPSRTRAGRATILTD